MKKVALVILVMAALLAMVSTALAERDTLPGGGVGVTSVGTGR
jgi:hypothetical protein